MNKQQQDRTPAGNKCIIIKFKSYTHILIFRLMTKFIPLFIILLTSSVSVLSQSKILDKPWIRESSIRHNSSYVHYKYRNSMFAIGQTDIKEPNTKIDSLLNNTYNQFSSSPLKIEDCVYFNPYSKFIFNTSWVVTKSLFEEIDETCFYLNKVSYEPHKRDENNYRFPNLISPYSLRFYADTTNISITPKQTEMVLDSNISIPLDNYLKPFYFRKYEVTNKEYKEFVNWVRDSIARQMLFDGGMDEFGHSDVEEETGEEIDPPSLNWKTPIPWDSPKVKELLEPLYSKNNERFARHKGIDSRKLNYVYYYISYTECPDGSSNFVCREEINVYPDTLCWIHDFNWSFNEPMTQNYFWHPAYNDYPVVGISYYQAIAFLHWKTQQHQAELDAKGIQLEVKYDLPTEAEWDIAATAEIEDKHINVYTKNYYNLADNSWVTDLSLNQNNMITHTDSTRGNNHYISTRNNLLSEELKKNYRYKSDYKIDGAFHTHKSNINLIGKKKELIERNELTDINQDDLGICFMGGNVSEWLKESYQENWKPIFDLRQRLLKTFDDKDIEILSLIERYCDQKNHQDGKLVRGGNWYDERFSSKFGKNVEGINAKIFISPDSTYSTLGFRYVIHVRKIN